MQRTLWICFTLLLCLFTQTTFALPFSVTVKAGTKLPTYVIRGSSALAYYTVRNETTSTRIDNFVKYLPPHVTQVLTNPNSQNPCHTNFSLTARGTPGDSCTLELKINGAVNAYDSNQRDHLFVCFPGGTTCAGTPTPLNVRVINAPPPNVRLIAITVTPSNHALHIGQTQQYTAQGRYSDNTLHDITNQVLWQSSQPAVASITPGGIATAISAGNTSISASLSGVTGSTLLSVKTLYAYISDMTNDAVFYCTVNVLSGALSSCTQFADPAFDEPQGLAVNKNGTKIYVANCDSNTDPVLMCDIPGGPITGCTRAYNGIHHELVGIALNPAGTHVYVSTNDGSGVVFHCDIHPVSGVFTNCHDVPYNFNQPQGIALNNFGPHATRAYVMNKAGIATVCSVNPASGELFDCAPTGGGNNTSDGVTVNNAGSLAYVTSSLAVLANPPAAPVNMCPILSNGDFGNCSPISGPFDFPIGASLTPSDNFLYIANNGNNTVSACPVNANGTIGTCTIATGAVTTPAFIAFGLV